MVSLEELLSIARECLLDENLSATSALEAARGHDSLTHLKFIMALEQQYGVDLGVAPIRASSTVEDVYEVVAAQRG
jgi:acyl carrier protein